MHRDWIVGFGAFSALVVLVGIDLALTLIAHRAASTSLVRSLRSPFSRR